MADLTNPKLIYLKGFLFLLGGVLSLVLLATRIRGRKDAIPFGPWLALGCVVAVLWRGSGEWMEDNYVAPIIDAVHAIF